MDNFYKPVILLFEGFRLVLVNSEVTEEKEEYLYDFVSLVAEFGGALGLFLGVSFMSLWDGVHVLKKALQRFQEQGPLKFYSPSKI